MYLKQKIDLKIIISSGKFKLLLTFSTCSNLGVTLLMRCIRGVLEWDSLYQLESTLMSGFRFTLQNVALQLDGHCFSV